MMVNRGEARLRDVPDGTSAMNGDMEDNRRVSGSRRDKEYMTPAETKRQRGAA